MPYIRLLSFLFLLCATGAYCTNGYAAESVNNAKEVLSGYESKLMNAGAVLKTIETRMKSYPSKIADAKAKLADAEIDLQTARSDLIQAQHDKSDDAARKLTLAEKRYELAEMSKQNREKRLERLTKKLAQLESERDSTRANANTLQTKIKDQTKRVLQLTTLASKQQAAAKLAVATPLPTQTPTPTPAPVAPEVTVEEETGTTTAPALTSNTNTEPTPKQKTQTEQSAQERYAQQQMASLNKAIAEDADAESKEWNRYKGLELATSKNNELEFEFLGNYQYYIETELDRGKQQLKIGNKRYRIQIPEAGTYVIIYNTKDADKPKFIIFNKKLINE